MMIGMASTGVSTRRIGAAIQRRQDSTALLYCARPWLDSALPSYLPKAARRFRTWSDHINALAANLGRALRSSTRPAMSLASRTSTGCGRCRAVCEGVCEMFQPFLEIHFPTDVAIAICRLLRGDALCSDGPLDSTSRTISRSSYGTRREANKARGGRP